MCNGRAWLQNRIRLLDNMPHASFPDVLAAADAPGRSTHIDAMRLDVGEKAARLVELYETARIAKA